MQSPKEAPSLAVSREPLDPLSWKEEGVVTLDTLNHHFTSCEDESWKLNESTRQSS